MSLSTVLTILTIHYVADFLCQTDWMAVNKSKRADALLAHVAVYTGVFMLLLGPSFGVSYALLNGLLHLVTDFITSRASAAAWKAENRHMFFCIIGLDQLIHSACLLYTAEILLK